jgi:16S rRNA (guanine527-N7)-methyltransferase
MASELERVLVEARRRSLVGNAPIAEQIAHSEGFARALALEVLTGPVVEIGSGGGLPGLVLAVKDPALRMVLLDSSRRAAEFLRWSIAELELATRVEVVNMRAEDAGRDARYRGRFAAVLARSFAPPAVTVECAAPFLLLDGRLIVSEPPVAPHQNLGTVEEPLGERWPVDGCGKVGLVPELAFRDKFGYAVLRQSTLCPERYPRRSGIPSKRPLFS